MSFLLLLGQYFLLGFSTLVFWRYFLRVYCCRRAGSRRIAERGDAILVTGCDRGFGRLIAVKMHSLGATVYAGCLSQDSCTELNRECNQSTEARMVAFRLDVTKSADVASAVELVKKGGKRLAAVVNNAGISAFGWAEALDVTIYERIMNVNFLGTVRITKAFLPLLREHRGRLVNMGSIGARMPSSFGSAYLSSKAAMCSYSDCVRQELHRFGVHVALVEPGFFSTGLLESGAEDGQKLSNDPEGYPEYGEKMKRTAETIRQLERLNGLDCKWVIDAVKDAVVSRYPLARYTVGWDARLIRHVLAPFLPAWFIDKVQTAQDN